MNNCRTSALAVARGRSAPQRAQRGVVVFIALIVLVAMMLAGIAVMRSSGSAILTAGNLAFRQNATVAGDRGLELARAWLVAQGTVTLAGTVPAAGYCETWEATFRAFTPATWTQCLTGSSPALPLVPQSGGTDAAGNAITYVIHRMCRITGTADAANQECVTVSDPGKGGPKEAGAKSLTGTSQVYYRITARIDGPKNTVSFVQTMVY